MERIYSEELNILLSSCGFDGKLSLTGALNIFMDIASLHEEEFGYGIRPMEKRGLFWIIGKNRVHFYNRPGLMDKVRVYTWFETPKRLYGNRCYAITDPKGELLVSGCTEWLVATEGCAKLVPLKDFIPAEYKPLDMELFRTAEHKINKSIDGMNLAGIYTVSSENIDYIGHMNNTAYSRAIMSFISSGEIAEKGIKEAIIYYNHQVLEGSKVQVYRLDEEIAEDSPAKDGFADGEWGTEGGELHPSSKFSACLEDGTNVFTARINWGKNNEKDLQFRAKAEAELAVLL